MQHPKVAYVLTGFQQDSGCRVYSFERLGCEPRLVSTVRADLALARKHGILTQELPLLCREALEHDGDDNTARTLLFSEDAMLAWVAARQQQRELAARKKLWKTPPPARPASASRPATPAPPLRTP